MATSQSGHHSSRPRDTHDKPHAGVNPCERRRSGHSRQAKSFQTFHPLNVIQVLYFLECRQIGEVDSRHWAAGSFAVGGSTRLLFAAFLSPATINRSPSSMREVSVRPSAAALRLARSSRPSGSRTVVRDVICQTYRGIGVGPLTALLSSRRWNLAIAPGCRPSPPSPSVSSADITRTQRAMRCQ